MKTEPIPLIHIPKLTGELVLAKRNAMRALGKKCRVTLYLGMREQNMFKVAVREWVDIYALRHSETKTGEPWEFQGCPVVPVNLPSFYRIGTELEWD